MFIRVYFEATRYSSNTADFYEKLGHELFWAIEQLPEVVNVTYKSTRPYPNKHPRSAAQYFAATVLGYVVMRWNPGMHYLRHPKRLLPDVAQMCSVRMRRVIPVGARLVRNLPIHWQYVNLRSRQYVESRSTWLE